MTKRIVVIQGHPDAAGGHYCHALAEAYARGAQAGGHQVQILDPARLDLPFVRHQQEWDSPPDDPLVRAAQEAIGAADHLVILYPLWLGDMPATLKCFLEQVSRGGFMIRIGADGGWEPMLKGKSARVIVTMGMPALAYRLFYFSHSLKSLERNILKFSGVSPVRDTLIGMVQAPGHAREAWLGTVEKLGRSAA